MDKQKIYNLIDECRMGMREVDEYFEGSERINTQEEEQKNYNVQFKKLGINPKITSDIYSNKDNLEGIEKIKNNITNYLK